MKKYSVITTENCSVGYPKGFDSFKEALQFFSEKINEKAKAILVRRTRSLGEVVIDSEGLTDEEVNILMGRKL